MASAPSSSRYICPVPRYGFHEEGTFARDTIVKRWPVIIKDTASAVTAALSTPEYSSPEATSQGRQIVRQIKDLLMTISKDEEFQHVAEDGGVNVSSYNEMIDELRSEGVKTWYDLPWLFAECLLYRTLRTYFALQPSWTSFDPYFSSKVSTFKSSSHAVIDLSRSLLSLPPTLSSPSSLSLLQPIFHTYTQTALWGNATDLSMLAGAGGLTEEALRELQKRGKEEEKFILRNDEGRVWEWLVGKLGKEGEGRRCDIVLDNAGFELYTDMIYADFLLSHTPFFDEVVFHPKTIPWFVSDVLPVDFSWIISTLLSPSSFFPSLSDSDASSLRSLGARFQAHVDSGKFKLSTDLPLGGRDASGTVDFWTNGCEYQRMVEKGLEGAEETLRRLEGSALVVFKGDLNYRKLTCDAKWKSDAPFEDVLGPLNGRFPILSLRTNKAEVIVGLKSGLEEKIEKEDPKWRVNGKWAVVSFAPGKTE